MRMINLKIDLGMNFALGMMITFANAYVIIMTNI